MRILKPSSVAVISILSLAACGGGGGGGGGTPGTNIADRFTALQSDPTLSSRTMQSTVDGLSGSVTYEGVVNLGTNDPSNPAGSTAYLGDLSMTVDFSDSTMDGTADNFVQYFSEVASNQTGSSVSGSLDIDGALTGNNDAGIGDGITGTAVGSIDGASVSYEMDGNITGVNGDGMSLFFDGEGVGSGGVGFAVR